MLISHARRFIYLKTIKTAGTSVEAYFEKHCLPSDQQEFRHTRETYEGPAGVVGYRGPKAKGEKWFNHMSAESIRTQMTTDQWNTYFKFCVIRDPFDKLVSGFHMLEKRRLNRPWFQRAKAYSRRLRGKGDPIDRLVGKTPTERFRSWIKLGGMIDDRNIYTLAGDFCADFFMRFEHLTDSICEVCNHLGIDFSPSEIPRLKNHYRTVSIPLADYYDDECIDAVRRVYARELDYFGYKTPR